MEARRESKRSKQLGDRLRVPTETPLSLFFCRAAPLARPAGQPSIAPWWRSPTFRQLGHSRA